MRTTVAFLILFAITLNAQAPTEVPLTKNEQAQLASLEKAVVYSCPMKCQGNPNYVKAKAAFDAKVISIRKAHGVGNDYNYTNGRFVKMPTPNPSARKVNK
jgi:hypothetical protein